MLGKEPILTPDGAADRRRQGPPLVRDQRRVRALGRQAHPAVVPAARVGHGRHEARGRVLRRALPGDRRRRRERRRCSIPTTTGSAVEAASVVNILVCVKRVPATGRQDHPDRRRARIDTRYLGFTVSPHEECAVEEAVRLVEAHGGTRTVLTLGPEEAADQLREAMAVGIDRAILLETDGGDWDPMRHGRGDRRCDPGARGRRRAVRPDPVRQRGRRHRRLPGRDPGRRTRSIGRSCPA